MTDTYGFVVDRVFKRFIDRDVDLLQAVADFDGEVNDTGDTLVFTLPALFALACDLADRDADAPCDRSRNGYLQFRRSLYANPTNAEIGRLGGRIDIDAAGVDHDSNTYKLVRVS